jgi:hypothetical protein
MNTTTNSTRRLFAAVLSLPILMGLGLLASAAIPDSDGTIHGCYRTSNGSLRVADPAAGGCRQDEMAIQWNQTGPTGPQGIQGPQGTPGPAGGFSTELGSGQTVRGVFAAVTDRVFLGFLYPVHQLHAADYISFPAALPSVPVPQYCPYYDPPTAECPGTAADPQAAPGYLCVYASSITEYTQLQFIGGPVDLTTPTPTRFGTGIVFWNSQPTRSISAGGTWAVTAP